MGTAPASGTVGRVTAAGPDTDRKAIDAPTVEPGYKVPRLKDGKPDISGVWSNASNTTLRRGGGSKNLVMTDDEARKARAGNAPKVFFRGRTDAGVHALAQVCHFDIDVTEEKLRSRDLCWALRSLLPPSVVVRKA